ncbi:MAG: ABC transporter permease subunit [Deltaproteobacteria bacterium]|nr:ABC transporter permease subunit [Deltaproteobacteria bacterium]
MIRFILRRLWRMIPALLGIALVTFALVHLAPGDPVQAEMSGETSRGELSDEAVESFRRSYFLDLPLFLNTEINDLPRRMQALLGALGDPGRRAENVRAIARVGGAGLSFLVPRLESLAPAARDVALEGLGLVAERMGIAEDLSRGGPPLEAWRDFWEEVHLDFKPGRARRLALGLLDRDNPHAEAELRRLDTFALGQIIPMFEDLPSDADTLRLVERVAEATERDVVYDPAQKFQDRDRVLEDWQEWWWLHRLEYTQLSNEEHLVGAVAETQFAKWLARLVTLDFGDSSRDGRPVLEKIKSKLPVTLLLSLTATVLAYLLAVPLGVFSALRAGRRSDRVVTLGLFVLYSLPSFWVAMLAIRWFCGLGHLDWFPLRGLHSEGWQLWPWWKQLVDTAHHMVLPVLCLTYGSLAALSRYQRVAMLDVVRQDYIRTARAKGLSRPRVIWSHALRNALIPIVTLLGLQIPFLIGGSVVIERIFNIEGMGLETFEAIRQRDYNWILAVSVISAVLTMIGLLISDVLYAVIDPRMRQGVEGKGMEGGGGG